MRQKRKYYLLFNLAAFFLLITMMPVSPVSAGDQAEANPEWIEWGHKYWPPRPTRGGYLRVAAPLYIGVLNPNHFPVSDWVTMSYLYEKLINHDGSFKASVPWLAESWEYLDPLTVLMKLRKGVKFHDGTDFNAESLKYQISWIMDPNNGAWTKAWLKPLKSVEVIDEYTVKWHFKKPWGAFAGTMASVPGMMISAKALKADAALTETKRLKRRIIGARRTEDKAERKAQKLEKEGGETARAAAVEVKKARRAVVEIETRLKELAVLTRDAKSLDIHPVGSGQFMLEKADPGNSIRLKRNPHWWYGKLIGHPNMPYFDGVDVSVIPDPSIRVASLKARKLDTIQIKAVQYRLVRDDVRFNTLVQPLNWLIYMMINQTSGPLKDIRVRKAISHAIDREALVKGTQFGLGRVATCIFPSRHWARNPDLKPVRYDPELSKKLLAEAGYADGLKLKGFSGNLTESRAVTVAIKAMLEKAGIQWKVTSLDIAAMAEPITKLDYDIALGMWPWVFEPDMIASMLYHPDGMLNNGRNRNEEAIALIEAGRQETDEAERTKIYRKLEKVLMDNYEDIWLWYPLTIHASTMNLRGIDPKILRDEGEGYWFSHPMWFYQGRP